MAFGGRMVLLLLLASGLAACAPTTGQRPIRGVETRQLEPSAPVSLAGNDGVIVGVTITARHFPGSQPSEPFRRPRSLVFADAAGKQFAVPIMPLGETTLVREEEGARLWLTPYAMQLPAGRYSIVARAVLTGEGQFGGWELITSTQGSFEVTAGRITYLGGFGELTQALPFPSQAARDTACRPEEREHSLVGGYSCRRYSIAFLWNGEAADLAQIRTAFPSLANATIESRLMTAGEGLFSWPAVLVPPRP